MFSGSNFGRFASSNCDIPFSGKVSISPFSDKSKATLISGEYGIQNRAKFLLTFMTVKRGVMHATTAVAVKVPIYRFRNVVEKKFD